MLGGAASRQQSGALAGRRQEGKTPTDLRSGFEQPSPPQHHRLPHRGSERRRRGTPGSGTDRRDPGFRHHGGPGREFDSRTRQNYFIPTCRSLRRLLQPLRVSERRRDAQQVRDFARTWPPAHHKSKFFPHDRDKFNRDRKNSRPT
mgnify:FL=1